MADLDQYIKYYFLENYLFDKVNKSFQKKGYLTSEEFFAIVIWKSNRPKTKIREGFMESKKTVRSITSEIFKAKTPEQKLNALVSVPGIGISIASAILSVCYPDEFTIVDYRARRALKDFGEEIGGDPTERISAYMEYLARCKKLASEHKLSLRDFDRALWTKDFYEGESGLKHLSEGL